MGCLDGVFAFAVKAYHARFSDQPGYDAGYKRLGARGLLVGAHVDALVVGFMGCLMASYRGLWVYLLDSWA